MIDSLKCKQTSREDIWILRGQNGFTEKEKAMMHLEHFGMNPSMFPCTSKYLKDLKDQRVKAKYNWWCRRLTESTFWTNICKLDVANFLDRTDCTIWSQLSIVILFVSQLFVLWSYPGGGPGLSLHFIPQGNFLQLVLVAVAERRIWLKICNLKDGGHGDEDRGIWERRGHITIIRASSFAHKPKLSPHHHPPKLPLVHSHTH